MATTWDNNHKTNTTLSGGNLVATSSGAGGTFTTRPVTGKTYFECTPTTLTGTPSVGIATLNWNTSTDLKSGTNTLAYLATGAVTVNGTTLSTIATWAQGNRIDCAIDPTLMQIWFRVAGGNWNNNVSNNPATGVGGIDYSGSMTSLGTLAAAVYASLTGNVWTAVFSSGSFAGTAPSGFSSLDAVGYTLARNVEVRYEANPVSAQYLGPVARAIPHGQDKYQRAFTPAGAMTQVSGTVQENGSGVSGKTVWLYDRITGDNIGQTVSDGSGNWSMYAVGRPQVLVVCNDPTTYNSQIYDDVTPA